MLRQLTATIKSTFPLGSAPRRWASRLASAAGAARLRLERARFGNAYVAAVFTRIYQERLWAGIESLSGPGSSLEQTDKLRAAIPDLLKRLNTRILLDIPCGDWHWMSKTVLPVELYIGCDIIEPLIKVNQSRFQTPTRQFRRLDLLVDPLPAADVILCRDCLVHFSFAHIAAALANMKASRARYLLTTTFPARDRNTDTLTGQWRPLNLSKAPFTFPPPLALINEGNTEDRGRYADKSLAVYFLHSLPDILPLASAHETDRKPL